MNNKAVDKVVSQIFRSIAKKDIEPDTVHKLQDKFNKTIQHVPESTKNTLIQAFKVSRNYWRVENCLLESEYAGFLKELLDINFVESADVIFKICVDSIAKIGFEMIVNVMPSYTCINLWVKRSKIGEKTLLKSISCSWDRYYETIWCDWFVNKAPIKNLLPLAMLVLQGKDRPRYLPDASELLMVVITRDRKFLLTNHIIHEVVQDTMRIKALVAVCSRVAGRAEAYARGFGLALATEIGAVNAPFVVRALEELIQGPNEVHSQFAALFAAHITTTWLHAVGVRRSSLAVVEEALLNIGINTFLFGQDSHRRNLWIACTAGMITEKVLTEKEKVSPLGAVQVALGLRAAQMDANAIDALWSIAYNLGIRELEKPEIIRPFDPILHEDIRGGLLKDKNARVVRCGWKLGDRVLLRAQVEPV